MHATFKVISSTFLDILHRLGLPLVQARLIKTLLSKTYTGLTNLIHTGIQLPQRMSRV